ncbi:MAG: AI-2E family transporter [Candidatus Portnoybacteria bacterium]|nr:AI-2E family transporter [Candidatus Portnoybacteria bacterium]
MQLDITYRSVLKVILILAAVWFLYQIIDVLAVVFFGVIIASATSSVVDRLEKEGLPRVLGALLIYLLIILALSFIIYIVVPPTISQISKLSGQLPTLLRQYFGSLDLPQDIFEQARQGLANVSANITEWLISLAGGLSNVIFIFIISFYLTVQDEALKRLLRTALPRSHEEYVLDLITRSQNTLAQWLKAQLTLMLSVGILTFIALFALGIPHAFAIGLLAGILEIIPFVGPVIAAVPAIIFALDISPLTAFITLGVFVGVQQLESHFLTPFIMKRAFEINPVLVLLALFIGAKFGGIVGILASVPLLALVLEFSKDYYAKKRND